ncbi:MAG: hypothetical protein ABL877_09820 [Thiobacillus sp.]
MSLPVYKCATLAALLTLLPLSLPAVAAATDADLEGIGERIRQTGDQIREDMRRARARLDAQKAHQELERKQEAARQQAAVEQAALRETKQRQAQETQARARKETSEQAEKLAEVQRAEREAAAAAQPDDSEAKKLAAKAKAAEALQRMRASAGVRAFVE